MKHENKKSKELSDYKVGINRIKAVMALIGTLVLISLGVFIVISPESFPRGGDNELVKRIFGGFAIMFFGVCLLNLIKFGFFGKRGLLLNNRGIFDNSNPNSLGWIEWEDITKIEEVKVVLTSILLVYTNNPQKYIERGKSAAKRKILEINYRKYGTPLSITAGVLNTNTDQLKRQIEDFMEARNMKLS